MSFNNLYDRISRDPALGELRDGATRIFQMHPDAFMDAFRRLDLDARYTMFAAFAQSISKYSGQSVKHYRHELSPAAQEIFLNAAVNITTDMGWGSWRFVSQTPGEVILNVTNSPFARELNSPKIGPSNFPVCAPILGLTEALGGIIFSNDPLVQEVECAAVNGGDNCQFIAQVL